MVGSIVLLLIIANSIRLVGLAVGYDIPMVPTITSDDGSMASPPSVTIGGDSPGGTTCTYRWIFGIGFPTCTTEDGGSFFDVAANAILAIFNIFIFLINMVLAVFVVPAWLLTIPEIPHELRLAMITPIVVGYGFVGYKAIRG